MRILWIATKAPWPPVDGGRLLLWNTLEGLRQEGCDVSLIAPASKAEASSLAMELEAVCRPLLVREAAKPRWQAAVSAALSGRPWTIERHASNAVSQRVRQALDESDYDCVQVEQVQAWANAAQSTATRTARAARPPVVWRAQNVESDLWSAVGSHRRWLRPALLREARKLATYEGRAVAESELTCALTQHDAARLSQLAQGCGRVEVLPAPFASELPAGETRLPGDPALVLFGSGGWWPNQQGVDWFLGEIWPAIHHAHPRAVLHLCGFGADHQAEGVHCRPAPGDSREVLSAGTVLIVPLHIASGVRMKILEGWARGVPVIATSTAARGLQATAGQEYLQADDAEAWVAAVAAVRRPQRVKQLVDGGRALLADCHEPRKVARQLAEFYASSSTAATMATVSVSPE